MTKLIGISGSLRRGSFNTALLRTAAEFVPDGAELTVETIHGIPLYDADVETADGIPERVSALKEAIAAADGLLLATPEYNNSMPRVFSKRPISHAWIGDFASDSVHDNFDGHYLRRIVRAVDLMRLIGVPR